MQAAFKIKEFRELTKMENCHLKIDLNNQNGINFNDNLLVIIIVHEIDGLISCYSLTLQ